MIAGFFHQGSGLGNQLHRYVMTRVLALDKGCEWAMDGEHLFKGKSFMNLDMGSGLGILDIADMTCIFQEKKVVEDGVDIRGYDPEINFVLDNTIIDGEFQDERYFSHRLPEIKEWLKVEPLDLPNDLCIIGFRGGEYSIFPDLFLTIEYWQQAIEMMLEINPKMQFEVHTDDPETAKLFFQDHDIVKDMEMNWRSVRYAKYAIIANSSFYIFPRLLKHQDDKEALTIAPRYWARRNTKVWALPQNYYKKFTYI